MATITLPDDFGYRYAIMEDGTVRRHRNGVPYCEDAAPTIMTTKRFVKMMQKMLAPSGKNAAPPPDRRED